MEQDLRVFQRWVQDEKASPPRTSDAQKRHREPTPSKTPRALKKFCDKPASPGRGAAVRVIAQCVQKNRKRDHELTKIQSLCDAGLRTDL
ncbi:hypothetical protein PBY51_004250 [Eleginops maclovinus]|uniref:Uncharacterized protein n=1 Tax=Eleginops maclovinus TaxID=56733 RepID=A0AAN7Y2G3_ELEMC|nr:hypothetical protein PBY51_004250 [Eleginops maclovinus]